jgi:heterodisulfide reductase subunit B
MEAVLEALGAEMVPFAPKTKCCGGSLTGTMPEVGMRLCYQLLREAKRQGADLIVTVCPLCQFNLDAYQGDIAAKYENVNVPVVYFTQMMAHAFGLPPAKAALFRSIVSAESVVHGKLAASR